jgi:clan AA aspartic protease
MQGTVVGLQPQLKIPLRLRGNHSLEIECVLDTGFDGALTLPPDIVTALGLPLLTWTQITVADGRSVVTPVYRATILWQGSKREVSVLAIGQRPLMGTALLEGLKLTIEFDEGGSVCIEGAIA